VSYAHSLEERVERLIQENRKLEEERAEMEEAENDSRRECQRYEVNLTESYTFIAYLLCICKITIYITSALDLKRR
jgi:hypothetical protein